MSRYTKTLVMIIITILTALKSALVGPDGVEDNVVTLTEWLSIALAALGTVLVYALPNTPATGEDADPHVSERDV